jgi:hypothetical protein
MRSRRPSPAVALSIALHVVLGVGLVRVMLEPGSLAWMLPRDRAEPPKEERIAFVRVAPAARPLPPSVAGRAGGDGRPERAGATRSAPRIAPPTQVPSVLPSLAPGGAADAEEGGTGPLVGGGGPLRGVQPRYGDPRVWRRPADVAPPTKTHEQRLDSAFAVRFKQHQDSMAVIDGMRKPGDWTVARADGSKWGVEPAGTDGGVQLPKLWLGRIAIPLPLSLPVRPGQLERERALRAITSDVAQQSTRRLTEDEFRKAVKQIRVRKVGERSRQTAGQKNGDARESVPGGTEP